MDTKIYFGKKTGIPDFDEMDSSEQNINYYRENKNKEKIILLIPPLEYLRMCEKGFKEIGHKGKEFTPESSSVKRVNEMMNKAEKEKAYKLDMPNIEEIYSPNWNRNEEVYRFSQEGRHRALEALKRGVKFVPVAYIRSCDMESKIGMEKYFDEPKSSQTEEDLKQWKKESINILKSCINNIIEFSFVNKRYLDERIAGYVKYSSEDEQPIITINKNFDEKLEYYNVENIKDYIVEDSIFHEYGHILFELSEDSEMFDKIKGFYSSNNDENNFKNHIINQLNGEEFNENDIDYYYEEFWDYYYEEEFAEDFSKYIRIKSNNEDYYNNCKSIETLNLSMSKIIFFNSLLPLIKTLTKEYKKERDEELNYSKQHL